MIEKGKKVTIHYTLTVEGRVVDTTEGEQPLVFEHGSGQLIPGFEDSLSGLKTGDKKNFEVSPEEGYGPHNASAVEKIPRDAFKDETDLAAGKIITGQVGEQPFQATIIQLDDKEVTLDLNHPLAGKTLSFEVEILAVD